MSVFRLASVVAAVLTTGCVSESYGQAPAYPPGYDAGMGSGQYVQQGDLFGGQNVADVRVFYGPLAQYGTWVESQFGYAFRPDVDASWRPYVNGRWGEDRLWLSDDPWGWATDHYGRWGYDQRIGWVWVPATQWAPSWVAWREDEGQDVAGWAPIPPGVAYSVGVGFASALAYDSYASWYAPSWVWVPRSRIYTPGFGGVLPWRYGQSYWGHSHWNHDYGGNGHPGYGGRPPGYSNGYSNGGRPPGYNTGRPGYGTRPPRSHDSERPPNYTGAGRPPGYAGSGRPPGYAGSGRPPGYTGSGRPPGSTGDGRPPVYAGTGRPPGTSWAGQSGQGRPDGQWSRPPGSISAQHGGNGRPNGGNWQGRPPQHNSAGTGSSGNPWGNRPPSGGGNPRPPGSDVAGTMPSQGRPGHGLPPVGAPGAGTGSRPAYAAARPQPVAAPAPRPERSPPQSTSPRNSPESGNEKPQ